MNEIWHITSSGKRYKGVYKTCANCNNQFTDRIRGIRKFCCLECSTERKKITVEVSCAHCGNSKHINPSKTKNSKSGLYFCNRECKCAAQKIGGIKEIMPPHYGVSTDGRALAKRLKTLIENPVCYGCGDNRKYLLCMHHKDGDCNNNTEENLEIVCGNCHMIRHLKCVKGVWIYNTSSLTPRELIPTFN